VHAAILVADTVTASQSGAVMKQEDRPRDTDPVSGVAEIGFASGSGATCLVHLYQRSPLRVLFPAPETDDLVLAALVTTSGGLVAGDRIAIELRAEAGAAAHVTTAAAEKIYRSTGATTEIVQSFSLAGGAWLEYLPQETILFDGARLRRHTAVTLAAGARFLGGGITVFGRRAGGERFTRGLMHDRLEVCCGDVLIWGDALHLDGDVADAMGNPACFDDAAACATMILASPDAEGLGKFIEGARDVQRRSASAGLRAEVSLVNGVLVARWLGEDAAALRRAYADLACHLRAAASGLPARLPRLWHS
jgi:urease accessory protein